jgi:hypothetical protein
VRTDFSEFYVQLKNEPEKRWPQWDPEQFTSLSKTELHRDFIPVLHNTQSAREDARLHWMFVQFNAEAQIVLEQLFIYALRKHLPFEKDPSWKKACRKLMVEEFLHARAYRKFLKSEEEVHWPKWSMTLRGHRGVKWFLCHLLRVDPVCMILPAAKFETYSLFYSNYLIEKYKVKNRWTELNRMHKQDEVHHVNFDYVWYDKMVRERSIFQQGMTAFRSALFFLGMQILLVKSCFKIMKELYPDAGLIQRSRLGLRFAHWGVRRFQPYVETRKNLKEAFLRHKFIHHRLLSFMYW